MEKYIPIITKFRSSLKVHNKKGAFIRMENRETSAFIVVLHGKIRFTQNGREIIASPQSPIYIPGGSYYLNECLEDAESLLFNFDDTRRHTFIESLSPIDLQKAIRIYERISVLKPRNSLRAEAEIFSFLYSLAREVYTENISSVRSLITPALEYIELHFSDADITVEGLAKCCCISSVYLNKLFKTEVGETPFSYITRRRMETAADMLGERCSVSEIAHSVGYSDIYQFSRAFKRFYGASPRNFGGTNT